MSVVYVGSCCFCEISARVCSTVCAMGFTIYPFTLAISRLFTNCKIFRRISRWRLKRDKRLRTDFPVPLSHSLTYSFRSFSLSFPFMSYCLILLTLRIKSCSSFMTLKKVRFFYSIRQPDILIMETEKCSQFIFLVIWWPEEFGL